MDMRIKFVLLEKNNSFLSNRILLGKLKNNNLFCVWLG